MPVCKRLCGVNRIGILQSFGQLREVSHRDFASHRIGGLSRSLRVNELCPKLWNI